MSLYIASLNSGSNGNCYYVGNNDEAVLVDVGISCREIDKRMLQLGLCMNKVKAVFISHEHGDHVSGLQTTASKYKLPVYITPRTLRGCRLKFKLDKEQLHTFSPNEIINIGSLKVKAFSKKHDANDPHSFLITYNEINVGVFTDIGIVCNNLVDHFKICHAAFLESNYCEDMLANGNYPYYLKKRITGGEGHLSNMQALQLFNEHRSTNLTHLILSHLSKNNNNPELVNNLFTEVANGVNIIVAPRYESTSLYEIRNDLHFTPHLKMFKAEQLSIF